MISDNIICTSASSVYYMPVICFACTFTLHFTGNTNSAQQFLMLFSLLRGSVGLSVIREEDSSPLVLLGTGQSLRLLVRLLAAVIPQKSSGSDILRKRNTQEPLCNYLIFPPQHHHYRTAQTAWERERERERGAREEREREREREMERERERERE